MWLPLEAEHAYGPVKRLGVFDSTALPAAERQRVTRSVYQQQFAVLPVELGRRLLPEPADDPTHASAPFA